MDKDDFDWGELVEVLGGASQDEKILAFPYWMTGWKKAFSDLNPSGASKRLIEILESPKFSMFNDGVFHCGTGGAAVNIGLLARWMARRALCVGSEVAVGGLRRLAEANEKPELDVLLLSGVQIGREHNIGDCFKLVPIESLRKYSVEHFGEYLSRFGDFVKNAHPRAALITFRQTSNWAESSTEDIHGRVKFYDKQDLFWLVLGLVCPGEAPTPLGRWNLLPSWSPFSGILDGGYTSRLEIKHPKTCTFMGDSEVEHAIRLYTALNKLPAAVSKPLHICLFRLNQSTNTWDRVEQAIDLGVALEAVLTPSKNTDQLSFQFRLLGALLVGDTQAERLMAFDVFKAFYNLRSKAVHNGEIPTDSVRISGKANKLEPREILQEATRLGRLAVIRLIERGGLSPEEYTGFLLSSGGRFMN